MKQENLEARVEKMEKELINIKIALVRERQRKHKLNNIVNKISSKARETDTTSLIRKMRNKNYE